MHENIYRDSLKLEADGEWLATDNAPDESAQRKIADGLVNLLVNSGNTQTLIQALKEEVRLQKLIIERYEKAMRISGALISDFLTNERSVLDDAYEILCHAFIQPMPEDKPND